MQLVDMILSIKVMLSGVTLVDVATAEGKINIKILDKCSAEVNLHLRMPKM